MFVATDLGLFRTLNAGMTFSLVHPGAARDSMALGQ